jgi:HK97 family phage prohead protease
VPYPGEHAARLKDPGQYDRFRRQNDKFGSGRHAIWGIKGSEAELQAIRFDASKHTVAAAKKWLADNGYTPIKFEPASKKGDTMDLVITERAEKFVKSYPDALPSVEVAQQLIDLYDALPPVKKDGIRLREFLLGERAPREETTLVVEKDTQRLLEGEFRGVAAATNVRFTSGMMPTVLKPGAFANTIENDRERVKILWQHLVEEPIGRPTYLSETDKGLEFIAEISDTQRGKEALELLRDGVITEVSIGWNPVKFSFEEDEESGELTRIVDELKLFEISLVSWGANPGAKVMEVNSDDEPTETNDEPEDDTELSPVEDSNSSDEEDDSPASLVRKLVEAAKAIRESEEPLDDEDAELLRENLELLHDFLDEEETFNQETMAEAEHELREAELTLLELSD